ncbi:MAG TPA: nitrogen fixation protein NifQ [Novimethylophilus sp.]|jgi:nitrogen fixation protein NifQ|uniref:nitrogen fixation protein NifQ n=1 Tax=Novimethylophilus sp. TaxID=2137426 RepID=UPI002F4219E5
MQVQITTRASTTSVRIDNRTDEFDDLVELLLDYRCDDSDATRDLAVFIAAACMGDNHLWQDMRLPNRAALTKLMQTRFPGLYAKNSSNMKWKKFFYKQLCERAEIFICKSPSCGVCVDYDKCFVSEDASG